MIGVWFTFAADGPALIESVAAFRAAGGTHIALLDDVTAPLPAATVRAVRPDMHEPTFFPRAGNLRGWPCVFGMLECFKAAADRFGESGCVKIDSDTLVLSLDWIDPAAPISGFIPGRIAHPLGLAYHIRRDAAQAILTSLRGRYRDESFLAPEDATIGGEATWLYGPRCHLTTWDQKQAGGWDFGRTPLERYARCQVITFGNRKLLTQCKCEGEKREKVALEMAKFRKHRNHPNKITP